MHGDTGLRTKWRRGLDERHFSARRRRGDRCLPAAGEAGARRTEPRLVPARPLLTAGQR